MKFTDLSRTVSISVRLDGRQIGVVMPILVEEEHGTPCDPPDDAILYPDESTRAGSRLIELRQELVDMERALEVAENQASARQYAIDEIKREIKQLATSLL